MSVFVVSAFSRVSGVSPFILCPYQFTCCSPHPLPSHLSPHQIPSHLSSDHPPSLTTPQPTHKSLTTPQPTTHTQITHHPITHNAHTNHSHHPITHTQITHTTQNPSKEGTPFNPSHLQTNQRMDYGATSPFRGEQTQDNRSSYPAVTDESVLWHATTPHHLQSRFAMSATDSDTLCLNSPNQKLCISLAPPSVATYDTKNDIAKYTAAGDSDSPRAPFNDPIMHIPSPPYEYMIQDTSKPKEERAREPCPSLPIPSMEISPAILLTETAADDHAAKTDDSVLKDNYLRCDKKSRFFSQRVRQILARFMEEHADYPYATRYEKQRLASITGLSEKSIMQFLSNWRRRHVLNPLRKRYSRSFYSSGFTPNSSFFQQTL